MPRCGHSAAAGLAVAGPVGQWRVCGGSGWGGGDGRCGVERVYWRLADEEAEDLAERVPGQVHPVPGGFGIAVLLLVECLPTPGFFLHQLADVAAEMGDELE